MTVDVFLRNASASRCYFSRQVSSWRWRRVRRRYPCIMYRLPLPCQFQAASDLQRSISRFTLGWQFAHRSPGRKTRLTEWWITKTLRADCAAMMVMSLIPDVNNKLIQVSLRTARTAHDGGAVTRVCRPIANGTWRWLQSSAYLSRHLPFSAQVADGFNLS